MTGFAQVRGEVQDAATSAAASNGRVAFSLSLKSVNHRFLDLHFRLPSGTDSLEMHEDAISHGQRVLLCDDLLATGGTAAAAIQLIRSLGGGVEGAAFAVELTFLKGRAKLQGLDVFSLIQYDK